MATITDAMEGSRGRARVHELAQDHLLEALECAKAIQHPWYRCQALTEVALYTADRLEVNRLLELAFDAAYEQSEPNRIVTVSAWPLSVLYYTDRTATKNHTTRLLKVIAGETHSIRRADGLLALLRAVIFESKLRESVLVPLLGALQEHGYGKAARIAGSAAMLLIQEDAEAAERLLSSVPEAREVRQARRMIAAGVRPDPRLHLPGHFRPSPFPALKKISDEQ